MSNAEQQAIKDQYHGVKKMRKKIIKPSEKFAKVFQFDWVRPKATRSIYL